jgi:hypothetical protein
MRCTALEAQQAEEEALLTETTCGGKETTDERKGGLEMRYVQTLQV